MNPIEFENRLDEAIAARDADELRRLRRFAQQDDACRSVWSLHEALDDAIIAWNEAMVDVDLTCGVLARIAVLTDDAEDDHFNLFDNCSQHERERRDASDAIVIVAASVSNRFRRGTAAAVTAAAALLLAVVLPLGRNGFSPEDSAVQRIEVTSDAPPPEAVEAYDLTPWERPTAAWRLSEWVVQARRMPSSLARQAASSVSGALLLVPSAAQADAPAADGLPEFSVLEQLGRNLEPVKSDVAKAVGFLFDVVPSKVVPPT